MARSSNAAGQFQEHSFSAALISFSRCRCELKRELKQPRRQRQGKRHYKNDFQIFQTCSRFSAALISFSRCRCELKRELKSLGNAKENVSTRPIYHSAQLVSSKMFVSISISDTMAALQPYCFEPESAGNSEDEESRDD